MTPELRRRLDWALTVYRNSRVQHEATIHNILVECNDALSALAPPRAREETGQHELLGFLAIHADRYQRDYGLNGLHPIHYDLMKKYGAPMERFPRATNVPLLAEQQTEAK